MESGRNSADLVVEERGRRRRLSDDHLSVKARHWSWLLLLARVVPTKSRLRKTVRLLALEQIQRFVRLSWIWPAQLPSCWAWCTSDDEDCNLAVSGLASGQSYCISHALTTTRSRVKRPQKDSAFR